MEVIIFLIVLAIVLIIALFYIYNNSQEIVKKYKNSNEYKMVDTIQDMFDIMGMSITADNKILKLNNILRQKFKTKYSTICIYDGNKYVVRASNVEQDYREAISDIPNDITFSSNMIKNISKHIIADKEKTLLYKSAIERNIKSALFSPIYYNNKLIGFWLLEDVHGDTIDDISEHVLSNFKRNLAGFIENVEIQSVLETAEGLDKQTGFYNNVYLYSNVRKTLALYDHSAVAVISLKGIPDINDKYNRNIGNVLLMKTAHVTKESLPKDMILIRYSGLKFLAILPGSTAQHAQPAFEKLLTKYKSIYEYIDDKKVGVDIQILLHTLKRQTNIEKKVQSMISYIDEMRDKNTIKII